MVKKKPSRRTPAAATTTPVDKGAPSFPIVGIGASAGGLAAFEEFFTHMPAETPSGMAFVLVQHLDPTHKSILTDLVKRYTRMHVYEVEDGMAVEPDCVYIIPPNWDLALLHGRLQLIEPATPRGLRLPIDFFFRSLAQDQGERAICMVLSGTGSDGALGLKAIKEVGGMGMVQQPESAQYDGMPRSAMATGLVDYTLPPADMPAQLLAYARHAFGQGLKPPVTPAAQTAGLLQKVFVLLRAQTGHDFSHYKQNTISRRVERRMAVNQLDHLEQYARYLGQNPLEVEALFRDLLIGVTNFFRDPEAFAALKDNVVPRLLAGKSPGETIRVWTPACSTGEEAYSIAILLQEHLDELKQDYKIQIFATDIDRVAIEHARAGIYPDSISADVPAERLARFFAHEGSAYRVKKSIRDSVVFAEQNVIEAPPFSKIDLISCRNLLIYLEAELQKKVLPLFHYALNPGGFLFLGNSETIGEFGDLFAPVDRKWKLYQRQAGVSPHAALGFSMLLPRAAERARPGTAGENPPNKKMDMRALAEQVLLANHTPAGALITERAEVLYIHGHTGPYLEPAAGEASLNILRMAREGLKSELADAIRRVIVHQEPVRYERLRVKTKGETQWVNLIVRPAIPPSPSTPGLLMVIFEDVPAEGPGESPPTTGAGDSENRRITALERELRAKEEYLQSAIEELETANEELKSTNEEMQSTNEELQSTNEELETSKEELQSVNEELMTVNAELQKKINEVSRANNDMNNLLAGTGVGTIFVDNRLRLQRFTPAAAKIINLIQTDLGRPLSHISSNLVGYDGLVPDAQAVLDTLALREVEVQTGEGQWYLLRILPYRTLENVIEGVVITFVEITAQKKAQMELDERSRQLQAAREYAESIVDTVREPLVALDAELKVIAANYPFYHYFQQAPAETQGRRLYDLGNGQWNIPELRRLLEEILPQQTILKDFRITHQFEAIGQRTMLLNAREVKQKEGRERLILLAIEDVTGRA